MQDNNYNISVYDNPDLTEHHFSVIEDYSELLKLYGIPYVKSEFYWQAGELTQVQGWLLDLSVIISQLVDLLHLIIPLLKEQNVPFKIVQNKRTARSYLDGNLGHEQMCKMISIYPTDNQAALQLAKKLIKVTGSFKGPAIPTDLNLGGIVYTRYGSFKPILISGSHGQVDKYIYDSRGELIKDQYVIPFKIPEGVEWPFNELASPVIPKANKNLQYIYRPLHVLKSDARGDVINALHLKTLLKVNKCVIKTGRKYMLSDDYGRDIQSRLLWQKELHEATAGIIPLPTIIDLFVENDDMYLVMDFIKGKSLYERTSEINFNTKTWKALNKNEKLILLDYLLKIVSIIQQLHQLGYVHRDIAPSNFMIDQNDQIILIDVELAYDLKKNDATPPFELGTPGFMSPEQQEGNIPTVKEDIFALGGLMIVFFTGLSPVKFSTDDSERLKNSLFFLTGQDSIAYLITKCLENDPKSRPEISDITSFLKQYQGELQAIDSWENSNSFKDENAVDVTHLIKKALMGMSKRPMPFSNGIWISKILKKDNLFTTDQKEYTHYPGLHTGIGGVLYLLAKIKRLGFEIDYLMDSYYKSWDYMRINYITLLPNFEQGLYTGAAGIGLSLAEGIRSDLIANNEANRKLILSCLDLPIEYPDLLTGISGQLVATLQCLEYLEENQSNKLLNRFISTLLDQQTKEGFWNINPGRKRSSDNTSISMSIGISGILCSLIQYQSLYPTDKVKVVILKGLKFLLKKTKDLNYLFDTEGYQKLIDKQPELGDERIGAILCLIKAYELLKDEQYKQIAEIALTQYPLFIVTNNFTQENGLSGLGELYLEAWKAFGNEEWKMRAEWIAQIFYHTSIQIETNACYWLMTETNKPVADFLTGNSGIIHFLARFINPDKIGYRLLT